MDIIGLFPLIAIAVLIHCGLGLFVSREILFWTHFSSPYKIFLTLLVWFIPGIGVITVYRLLRLSWFKKSTGENSVTGGVFLEMDSFVNSGAKHLIEMREKEVAEHVEDGEKYDPLSKPQNLPTNK